jgi:hypothetical protein
VLSREVGVNDQFQGIPIVIAFDPDTATGAIFRRDLDGKTLSFKRAQSAGKQSLLITDSATNSIWEGLTGTALQGPMKVKKLVPLPMTPSFWFGWVDHYPIPNFSL